MGWNDESDDDSFVPITEDEKKEFLSRQMVNSYNSFVTV